MRNYDIVVMQKKKVAHIWYAKKDIYGAWLSLVERGVRDAEVAGSNPVAPISEKWNGNPMGFPFRILEA